MMRLMGTDLKSNFLIDIKALNRHLNSLKKEISRWLKNNGFKKISIGIAVYGDYNQIKITVNNYKWL